MTLVVHCTPTPVTYRVLAGRLRPMLRLVDRDEVSGLERLPADGGFLVTPNHVSRIDPKAHGLRPTGDFRSGGPS